MRVEQVIRFLLYFLCWALIGMLLAFAAWLAVERPLAERPAIEQPDPSPAVSQEIPSPPPPQYDE